MNGCHGKGPLATRAYNEPPSVFKTSTHKLVVCHLVAGRQIVVCIRLFMVNSQHAVRGQRNKSVHAPTHVPSETWPGS